MGLGSAIARAAVVLGFVAGLALGVDMQPGYDGSIIDGKSGPTGPDGPGSDCVLPPTVIVTVPNGGEIWPVGTGQTITWTHGPVRPDGDSIWYRTKDSDTWCLIAALEPVSEGHVWRPVPDTPSENCRIRVKAYTAAKSCEDSSDNHFVIVHEDVGLTAILGPALTEDSGKAVAPRAVVRSRSSRVVSFAVTFLIGDRYAETIQHSLAPEQVDTVGFPTWIAEPVGRHTLTCHTALAGDVDRTDDTAYGEVEVLCRTRRDVGPVAILAPLGAVDSGSVVIPKAVVSNFGNCDEGFPVTFRIGGVYRETVRCSLNPGQTDTVDFPEWNPLQLGWYPASTFTGLTDDRNRSNDTACIQNPVEVVPPVCCDAGATAILSPLGTLCLGAAVTPKVVVDNHGNQDQTCPVTFRIGDLYEETVQQEMTPGQTDTVSFPNWTAGPLGTYVPMSFTGLKEDQNRANDTVVASEPLSVVAEDGHDMAATLIVAPVGDIDMGTVVAPRAVVHNLGDHKEACPVTLRIGGDYEETVTRNLSPGQTDTAHFPTWRAQPSGTHLAVCFTDLASDEDRSNDTTRSRIVVVPVSDIGVEAVLAPTGTILLGDGIVETSVTPRSRIVNHGQSDETDFEVRLRIDSVRIGPGSDTALLGTAYEKTIRPQSVLLSGTSMEVDFPEVVLGYGHYAVTCSTVLATDRVSSNDRDVQSCRVTSGSASTDEGRFRVIVYTRVGERVRTFESDIGPGDARLVQWDGIDDRGGRVAPGVYLCVLRFEPRNGPAEIQSFKLAVTSELTSAVLTWR